MKTSKVFAGAGLLVLPFIVSDAPGESFRDPKAVFLAVMFGLWIASELWQKVHPSLGCACGALFVYATFALTAPTFEIMALLGAFGSCLWIAESSEDDVKRGLEILEISGVLCAGFALLFQLPGVGQEFVKIQVGGLPSAAFGQQTLYGPFAVACFASALFHGRHFRSLLLIIPIFVISSSFTFLSLGVVLALYGFRRFGKKAILGLVLMAALLAGLSKLRPNEAAELKDDKSRFALWAQTIQLSNRHWFVGHGLSSFRVIYPIFQDAGLRKANGLGENPSEKMKAFFAEADRIRRSSGIFLHPHNELLSVYFEFGAIGLLIAAWLVCVFVISLFRSPFLFWYWSNVIGMRRWRYSRPLEPHEWALGAIFFSFLANSFGNFPFHLIPQALLPLWAFVAVTSRKYSGTLEADAT